MCGAASPGDMIGVRIDAEATYREGVCAMMACPDCAARQDPDLIATCNAGACEAVDLHSSPITRCTTSADCELRQDDCCSCSGTFLSIATAHDGDFQSLVCGAGPVACPPCVEHMPPPGVIAVCDGTHHCAMAYATAGADG